MTKAVETTPPREAPTTFEGLVTSFRGRIQRAAYLLCGDLDEAEELTQETFVRAWMGWSLYAGRAAVFTWLYGILINCRRERLRKRRFSGAWTVEPVATDPAPPDQACSREEEELVRLAIGRLREELREPLVLFYMQDLTMEEVGGALGIPSGTVKSRLFVARKAVREELDRLGWEAR